MKTLHPIQINILEQLLFSTGLKFSALKSNPIVPNNQLTFHVNALVEGWLIEKKWQTYSLTQSGKRYANSKDSHRDAEHKFQKVGVLMVCSRMSYGKKEYLFYTRKKHPFFDKQWSPTGKIMRWETPTQTAEREIFEETWLKWSAIFVKLYHFINKSESWDVIEDKYLFLCHISEPQWLLKQNNEWEFYWVAKKDIPNRITNPFDTIDEVFAMIDAVDSFSGVIAFKEIIETPEGF
jgi:ADP-ribose pyrophosphatase YjhB (NUDIX family)